ncbi:MAG: ZIP family metal transporter [Paludibacteraceae bacterium]|nr:ZIP family metal transporter [Paludibacteraceae bacterium]
MNEQYIILSVGLLLPFWGTVLGSGCVFLFRNSIPASLQKVMLGFAAGVMVAASVWSLLIPSMHMCAAMGRWSFLPAAAGMSVGMLFLWAIDHTLPHLHIGSSHPEGMPSGLSKHAMLLMAVTLHNIPEGMAVGIVLASALTGELSLNMAAALSMSIGIAIQNFPEGAVVSLPLRSAGLSRRHSFGLGVLSGIVEPIGAIIVILLAHYITPLVPYLLAFAAGSMLYVVVEELIPESAEGNHSNLGTIGFAVGFIVMMSLDVALG